jgi:hypothetical protein
MVFIKFFPKTFNSIIFVSSSVLNICLSYSPIGLAIYFFREITVRSAFIFYIIGVVTYGLLRIISRLTEKNSYVSAGIYVFWLKAITSFAFIGGLLLIGAYKVWSLLYAALPEGEPKDRLPYILAMCLIMYVGIPAAAYFYRKIKETRRMPMLAAAEAAPQAARSFQSEIDSFIDKMRKTARKAPET